jgi:primosomal protein N' (replication factor Y)
VAGRAGRALKKGTVSIQTHDPQHPLFDCLMRMDRDQFLKMELQSRKLWQDPPFSKQMALIVSGKDERAVAYAAKTLASQFQVDDAQILGPAPAPLAKLRDKYRYRLLVKSNHKMHDNIQKWLSGTNIPSSVRVVVDVDPVSFY